MIILYISMYAFNLLNIQLNAVSFHMYKKKNYVKSYAHYLGAGVEMYLFLALSETKSVLENSKNITHSYNTTIYNTVVNFGSMAFLLIF